MELWIPLTIAAAFFQNLRFMLQKRLKDMGLSAAGATYARFVFSLPVVALGVALYAAQTSLPPMSALFWLWALLAAASQVLATVCVVALFALRQFAVGITFKKSEVLQTSLVGLVLLGEAVSGTGLIALLIGLVALVILSDAPAAMGRGRFFNRAAGLGLLSGAFFALAGVAVRGATLALPTDDLILRAGAALLMVTALQVAGMTLWFLWRDRAQIGHVLRAWRVAGAVGLTGMLGSLCWFAAFSLQTAAYVYALGQIELIFSLLGGILIFQEIPTRREVAGIALLMLSILGVVLAAGP
ncbi:DMT family transporter [Actibacterium sp. 188UL27-1]|nr:DMT family transporter [Actibacterium sp. 188UL27-1]